MSNLHSKAALLLLASTSTLLAREVENGPCPHKPGQIKSNVAGTFDPKKIAGQWINAYDEKELTNQFLCMSVNFKPLDDGTTPAKQLLFEQASSIYEEARLALREQGEHKIADQKYFLNDKRKWVYDLGGDDKSVAQIEFSDKDLYSTLAQPSMPDKFNEYKFEKQFLKYSQILDTDYENYILAYSCQENGFWDDEKSGIEMDFGDVFKAYVNQAEHSGVDLRVAGTDHYAVENFENLKGIKKQLIHKQKIHVYTRPQKTDDGSYKFKAFDNMHLSLLLNDVTTKYLPKDFDQRILDHFYSKMVHDNDCDFNPYANKDYYQEMRTMAQEGEEEAKQEEAAVDHDEL